MAEQFSSSTSMDLALKIALLRGNTDTALSLQLLHLFIFLHKNIFHKITYQTSAWPFFMDATRGVLFRESLAWKLTTTTSTTVNLQPTHWHKVQVKVPETKTELNFRALVALVIQAWKRKLMTAQAQQQKNKTQGLRGRTTARAVVTSVSAPFSRSCIAISRCPSLQARWNGVQPFLVWHSTFALLVRLHYSLWVYVFTKGC